MGSTGKDFSTLLGVLLAFGLISAAIGVSGSGKSFIDFPSVLIVLGGTCAVTLASFTFKDFLRTPVVLVRNIFSRAYDPKDVAMALLDLAENARRKGLLAIQQDVDRSS